MMTMLVKDIRLALRQMTGSSDVLMTVLPLLVLGIALNVIALNAIDRVRVEMGGGSRMEKAVCMKDSFIHKVTAPVLKMIDGDQHRMCAAKGWVKDKQAQVTRYRAEAEQVVYCALGQTNRC